MASPSEAIARRAKLAFDAASQRLPSGSRGDAVRNNALLKIKTHLEANKAEIQSANEKDMALAKELVAQGKLSSSLVSRLDLFSKPGKWQAMLDGLEDVARLPSPLDECTFAKRLAEPSGSSGALDLYRITCPIGVLLCIFEARPEVIVNIAALAIKSGNAAILKGGKESVNTAAVMARVLADALASTEIPRDFIQTVETREDVAGLLQQDKYVDLIIPRGSNALVRSIQQQATMAVMGHADGLCCAYVHDDAPLEGTLGSVLESKTDYPAACNSLETLLLHEVHLEGPMWLALSASLIRAGVTLHCDARSLDALSLNQALDRSKLVAATDDDFDTEYLDLHLAVKTVTSLDEAIAHINTHGSHHTDAIFTKALAEQTQATAVSSDDKAQQEQEQESAAGTFVRSVSSANVYVNASTRFADGFRYGFGTEVGISTGKTHARGPVGLEGLVIYKYVIRGQGNGPQRSADFTASGRQWSHADVEKRYPQL